MISFPFKIQMQFDDSFSENNKELQSFFVLVHFPIAYFARRNPIIANTSRCMFSHVKFHLSGMLHEQISIRALKNLELHATNAQLFSLQMDKYSVPSITTVR